MWSRALAALAKDYSSIPSTHMVAYSHLSVTPVLGTRHPQAVCTFMEANTNSVFCFFKENMQVSGERIKMYIMATLRE